MNIVIMNVDFDSDGEEVISEDLLPILILDLPTDGVEIGSMLVLDDEVEQVVQDIISDETGWCFISFSWNDAKDVDQNILDNVKKIVQYEG